MDWVLAGVQQTGVLEQETEATRENLLLELT